MPGPYAGLRLVDLANAMPGAYAAMMLAELGADVVKVEPPAGDPLRGQPAFHVVNRSKRSVVADVDQPEGRRLVRTLLAEADVAITDYLPGEAERLDLGYTNLAAINPRLIYCSVPPMSSEGPMAGTPRIDSLITARAACMSAVTSFREGPTYLVLPLASYGAAFLALVAIGAALYARQRTGHGQEVEVSWLAGAIAISTTNVPVADPPRESPWHYDPQGSLSPGGRLYECADGKWLVIVFGQPTFFNKLCLAVDRADIAADPRFENAPYIPDRRNQLYLREAFIAAFKTRSRDEWIRILREWDVPTAPVLTRQEGIEDPQVVANGLRVEVDDPELGHTVQAAPPLKMSLTPSAVRGPAPRLGEHSAKVQTAIGGNVPERGEAVPVNAEPPLRGVRVLDWGIMASAPMVGKLLADLGAAVVKVESISGDPLRNLALMFPTVNRGKRSFSVNVSLPEGRVLVHELVRRADVVVGNFRPESARHLGLDYATLREVNPKIIAYSGTGYGTSGPLSHLPGYDYIFAAMMGLVQHQGGAGHAPVQNLISYCDHATGLIATAGLLAALYHRERTGEGQHVETSVLAASLAVQAEQVIFYEGKPAARDGGPNLLGISPLHRLYRAEDAWLVVAASTQEHWRALAQAVGRAELNHRYPVEAAIVMAPDSELASDLASVFATRTRDAWLASLISAGVPAAPALTFPDLPRDPQVIAESVLLLEDQPPWGRVWVPGSWAKFSGNRWAAERRSPGKGEHNAEILGELGRSGEEIAMLRDKKIVL